MDARPGDEIGEELAALRRVAVLVALGARPEEIFAAVAAEVCRLLAADMTDMARYNPDSTMTTVARWTVTGDSQPDDVRTPLGGQNLSTRVFETGRPARMDDYSRASGPVADVIRKLGVHSGVAAPIRVEGRLWGVMRVSATGTEPLPADTEARLVGFTELVGTAIANAQARVELRGYAEEQAALRRVATLVAGGAPPEEVFAAVAAEAGRLLGVGVTGVGRYEPGGMVTVAGAWSGAGVAMSSPVGTRTSLGGQNMATLVFETGRPARLDDYDVATGVAADVGHELRFRAAVGAPITVEGQLWGFMTVASTGDQLLPPDAETRLVAFTELAGTAIANAQARVELRGYAEEQAALRRVATLVARAAPPEEVFAAVTEEIGRVVSADFTGLCRYDSGGMATFVGLWTRTGTPSTVAVGDRLGLGGRNTATLVFQTGQPARIDDYGDSTGVFGDLARDWGFRSAAGAPIRVGGRLWGVVTVGSTHRAALPADIEARLVGFTELVGTAIANTEVQAALAASRARIVAAADETRRRIERDLHDGAQQRLVSLALRLREVQALAPDGTGEMVRRLDAVAAGLDAALDELREIARGIHPAVLAEGGLRPALKALARRCAMPVNLQVEVARRPPPSVEIAAYYVVSEALTNMAKHAGAPAAEVQVVASGSTLRVSVRDCGRGGADFGQGSGLLGLKDRVEALGGRISLHSPPGKGTTLEARIPIA
jgi:signal transduction histidine kinase